MKTLKKHLLTLLLVLPLSLWAQNAAPKFAKTVIGNSGCPAYLPSGMPKFDLRLSEFVLERVEV